MNTKTTAANNRRAALITALLAGGIMLGTIGIADASAQPASAEPPTSASTSQQTLEGVTPLQQEIVHGSWRADFRGYK